MMINLWYTVLHTPKLYLKKNTLKNYVIMPFWEEVLQQSLY